ncbi:hypothetical protein [Clostridium botulinum]|uniref:hypothetical protein n=1 Tax=Clostridium botulinum TaxID=1491 RepID=UPI0013F04A10|nr:hypothetical protein [Clostridium botulinum]MBY6898536.1 hypothetical protein [Clostridium botulinum]MBY6912836.1 hypothetical protein [Clostridium botulinum]MCR1178713.1 hypothetical protein [Clostridium botulinum]NFM79759.1 hypothetical protein [Clostridium botulinum]
MANLIVPEIYSGIVREKFEGKVKVANLATNLGYLKNTTVGDSVTFPKFKTIGDAEEVVKGKTSKIDELEQTSSQAKIKMIDKIVRVFDIDDITALGNHIDEASKQQAIVFARKLDSDLIAEALTSPLKCGTANAKAITADEINTGLLLFGDEQDTEEMAGIVVNSLVASSFYNMNEFVTSRTDTVQGNGIVRGGVIGYFRGIPVFMADHGTYDSTKNEAISFIVKKDSIAYMEKKGINIVEEREEKLHCSDIVGDYIYACKLINDSGVVVLRKTIA